MVAKDSWPTLGGVSTLYELFEKSVKTYPDNKCLGWRPIKEGKAQDYKFHSYKEVHGKALASCTRHTALLPGLSAVQRLKDLSARCQVNVQFLPLSWMQEWQQRLLLQSGLLERRLEVSEENVLPNTKVCS